MPTLLPLCSICGSVNVCPILLFHHHAHTCHLLYLFSMCDHLKVGGVHAVRGRMRGRRALLPNSHVFMCEWVVVRHLYDGCSYTPLYTFILLLPPATIPPLQLRYFCTFPFVPYPTVYHYLLPYLPHLPHYTCHSSLILPGSNYICGKKKADSENVRHGREELMSLDMWDWRRDKA